MEKRKLDFWNIRQIYSIDEYGNVYNDERRIMRKSHIDQYGYMNIVLYNEEKERVNFKIHRLVARAFIGEPPDDSRTQINHIDGNKLNNHYSNLEWVNSSENQLHITRMNLPRERLDISDDDMIRLVKCVLVGMSNSEIIREFIDIIPDDKAKQRLLSRIKVIRNKTRFKHFIKQCEEEGSTTIESKSGLYIYIK